MGVGTHTTVAKPQTGKNGKWMLMLAGTAVAILVAGVMVQVLRPPPAFPAAEAPAAANAAGQSSASDQQRTVQNVIARIRSSDPKRFEVVLWDELADECVARHGKEILENLINRRIIEQACKMQGIAISEAEVSQEIVRIAKKFGLTPENWLAMLETERKMSAAQYRRDIIWPMLALRKLAGTNITISDQDLQKAFERNYGPRVKARAIVLDKQRQATEVFEKAQAKGADFGRLARQYSVDPTSRALDGAIPPIAKWGGNDALEKEAFKLKPGEISGIIQTGVNQFIILQCEGHTEQVVENMNEVEAILRQELEEEKTQQSIAKVFESLKKEARVDNYLTHVSTGGDTKGAEAKAGSAPGQVKPAGATAPSRSKTKRTGVTNAGGVMPAGSAPASAPGKASTAPRRLPPPAPPAE